MILKCVIIDDDPLFTKILEQYLSGLDSVEIKGIYQSPTAALNKINFQEINFLFLDVEMPDMTGLEFLNSLDVVPPFVLVSSKKTYGVDAFEYNAIDYLYKPVSQARFLKSINKVKSYFKKKEINSPIDWQNIFIKHNGVHERLSMDDILIIRANDNEVAIITIGKTYKTNSRLKDIYDDLPQNKFMQVHRSFIIQISKIDKVDGEVVEIGGRNIPISRTYINELYERLKIK
jgi:DNA-binding LytR/AlgR family response regulator